MLVLTIMGKDDTRLAILKGALEVFSERGYLGAPTKDIAHAAGISEMTLFRHFETKQQLFEAVLATFIFQPSFDKLSSDLRGDLGEVLGRFAGRFLEMLKKNRKIISIVMQDLPRMREQFDALDPFRIRLKNILAEHLRRLKSQGGFTGDVDVVAITFVASLMGVFLSLGVLNAFGAGADLDKSVQELVHSFTRAYAQ